MGTFDEEGNYTPREVAVDDLGMSFADAIDGTMVEVEDGQLVNGTIVKIDKDEVLLDIGYKSEGVIPARELSIRNDVDPHEIVTLGEKVEALVLQKEDKEGRLLLSKKRAQYERAWGTIEKLKEEDGVVEGPVIEVVKGGLIVDIGLRGFLPASLVELRRVRDLQPYVGQTVQAKIIELDKNRNNVVLSRRAYLEETQKESRDQFLTNLKVGEVRTARCRRSSASAPSSTSAAWTASSTSASCRGSTSTTRVRSSPSATRSTSRCSTSTSSRERISLSLKATQQDPWQEFAGTHEVGQLVYGRVTKLVQFGAFVQVGDGIEGLVHISEMSTHHVDSPEQVVTPGEELWVKIIDLDLARRRISLSIKQAAEGGELAEEYREHFEVDEHGNWTAGDTTPSARPRGPSTTARTARRTRAPKGAVTEGAAADDTSEDDVRRRSEPDRRPVRRVTPSPSDPGRPHGRHRFGQVDGVGDARRARRGHRRRRRHRPRAAAGRHARCSTGWPSASAPRSSAPTASSTGRRWRPSSSTTTPRSRTSTPSSTRRCGQEIARRIDAEADTDHVVVLDMPLLNVNAGPGRSPPSSSSTCPSRSPSSAS